MKQRSEPSIVLQHSLYYQELREELAEILKHKWIESEKLGEDMGLERARLDWVRKYRDGWRQHRREVQGRMG